MKAIIYIRKAPNNLRRISVPRTHNIHHTIWLEAGYALDGNQVIKDTTLFELANEQRQLASILAAHYSEPVELDCR